MARLTESVRRSQRIARETVIAAAKEQPPVFQLVDLIVNAWDIDNERFGLDGGYHMHHPDPAKVYTVINGMKGLLATGVLLEVPGGFTLNQDHEEVKK